MNHLAVDTNAVLRYLVNDIPDQAEKISGYLDRAEKGRLSLEIHPVVVVEAMFQLLHWYSLPKDRACDLLMAFITPEYIHIPDKDAVFEAIRLFKDKDIDFVDLFIWARAKRLGVRVLSFDKHFDKLDPKLRTE